MLGGLDAMRVLIEAAVPYWRLLAIRHNSIINNGHGITA